jgi:hypothetical protein
MGHPLADNPDAWEIVRDIEAAQSPDEWYSCVSRLVGFLFIASTPSASNSGTPDRRLYLQMALRTLIARGPQPPNNRRPHALQARQDARNLRIRHAPSLAHAIDELAAWETPPFHRTLADREEWQRKRRDALRKRIERAEKAGGFRLPRRAKRVPVPAWDRND